MKTQSIYTIILLFFLVSCSKSTSEAAAESVNNEVTSSVSEDTAGLTSPELPVNVDQNKPETQTEGKQDTVSNLIELKTKASSPQIALEKTTAANDSVQAAFKKIKPNLISQHTEIINANLPALLEKKENNTTPVEPPIKTSLPPIKTPEEIEKPKNAVLGFSYFPQIPFNEERDLRVFVKIEGDGKQVAKKLKAIEKEDLEFTKTDDSSIVCIVKNIEAFKKLSIKPFYDYDDFRITKVDDGLEAENLLDPNEQILDFVNGNYWHWKVKAIAKSQHVGTVTLIIKAETPAGQKLQLAERQIKIKIGIDKPAPTFGEKTYNFFDAHFKEILSLIIIPLALFFFNFLRKKYISRQEENPKSPEQKI